MGVESVCWELCWVLLLIWLPSSHPGIGILVVASLCFVLGVGYRGCPSSHALLRVNQARFSLEGPFLPTRQAAWLPCGFSSVGLKLGMVVYLLFLCVRLVAEFFPVFCILDRSRNLCTKYFVFAEVVDVFRNTNYYINTTLTTASQLINY